MNDPLQERRDVETRIRANTGPLRKLADQLRRDADPAMLRLADSLAAASVAAAGGRLATSPILSTSDSYAVLVGPVRQAAERHGLLIPIEDPPPAPQQTPPKPAGERIPIPDVSPPLDFPQDLIPINAPAAKKVKP
jgi:hypothetical protein